MSKCVFVVLRNCEHRFSDLCDGLSGASFLLTPSLSFQSRRLRPDSRVSCALSSSRSSLFLPPSPPQTPFPMTTQTPSIDLPPDAITAPSPSPSSATSPSPTSTYPPRQTNSSRVNLEHLTPPTSDPTVSAAAEAQQHADVEKSPPEASTPPPLDIEHLVVHDDPRLWSRKRKNCILA